MADEVKGPSRREALRITAVAGIGIVLSGGLIAELVRQGRLHRVRVTRTQMGTRVTVTVVHPDGERARAIVDGAFAEMERLEAILSRHRAGTAVARLNAEGGVADAPPELREVVARALEYSSLTDGAFDPTVAPLLELHRARFDATGQPPGDDEVAAALALVGWRGLRVEGSTVAFDGPGRALTLDGIAKGYVVDRAVATLTAAGADRVMVDAGGDMASAGEGSESDPWRIAIQDPRDAGGALGVLRLRGQSVASSGDYMQAFSPDLRHHHILDPRTGRSPEHTSGVTVVAPTAMDADALSTAVLVLGPEAGIALLDRLAGTEGMVVGKDGGTASSRGFAAYTS